MTTQTTSSATRYLPQVLVATAGVVVLPVVTVWLLIGEGVVSSPWLCIGLALTLSVTASFAGSAYWKRRGHGDLLFSELLLWGWLYRLRNERRLANAVELLGLGETPRGLPASGETLERKAQVLRQMAASLDAQDPYTGGHSRRVALHSAMIARRMGLPREEVAKVRTAAAIHDIGKLRIPPEVLNKPNPLTPEEFEIVKRHADEGAEIVSCMEDPEITAMVRHHHERFDGSGYPAGMVGEHIPDGARIIAVADTFDALTSVRPYRGAIAHKQALQTILAVSGSQLDPVAVRAFLKCYTGKRAVLFSTILAASPQRPLALFGPARQTRISLGSAATVMTPAALAAAAAAAFGGAGPSATAARELSAVQQPAVKSVSRTAAPGRRQATGAHSAAVTAGKSVADPVKHAVLAVRATRVHRAAAGAAAPRSTAGSRVGGGGGVPSRHSGAGGKRGGRSHPGRGGSSIPVPTTVAITPIPSNTGAPPGSGGPPASPVASGGASGGSSNTVPSAGGSSPGNPTGSGGPGSTGGGPGATGGGSIGGGGSGGGSTGGGSTGGGGGGQGGNPGSVPHSKQDCWDHGYLNFWFINQGLCIAFVEHETH